MRYRSLGESGLRVSALSFGAGTLGSRWGPRWTMTPGEADALVGDALDHGINLFDTANVYNRGESEEWLGRALARANARERVLIATKYGYRRNADDVNSGGAGRHVMWTSVDASLRRLGTDHIDVLYLHLWDGSTAVAETLAAAGDLVRIGKIRAFALSNVPGWYAGAADALGRAGIGPRPVAVQAHYNLLERSIEGELFPFAAATGTALIAWGPLANGLLAGKYDVDPRRREVRGSGRMTENFTTGDIDPFRPCVAATLSALCQVADEAGCAPAQVALAWLLDRPAIASTVVGVTDGDQLRENLAALDIELSPAAKASLDAASAEPVRYPHTFLQPDVQSLVHGQER